MIDPEQVAAVVDDLGLSAAGDNWFVGQINGVPLALNVALTDIAVKFLFHSRHPSKNIPVEKPPIPPEFSLAKMAAEEKAEVWSVVLMTKFQVPNVNLEVGYITFYDLLQASDTF